LWGELGCIALSGQHNRFYASLRKVQWGALAADPAKNTTSARKTPRRDLM
jgi:hypothetical protein